MVLAIVSDLLFRAKIEAAAAQAGALVTVVSGGAALVQALTEGRWSRALIDLSGSAGDPLAAVAAARQAGVPEIIGYCSHVDTALQTRALAAGCHQVLPRSAFVQRLPELLAVAPGSR